MQASSRDDGKLATAIDSAPAAEPRGQLRALYVALLMRQERFDEFKQLLATYPKPAGGEARESAEAAAIRQRLNHRIGEWIETAFELAPHQVLAWRAALVEQQMNVTLAAGAGQGSC
jgi:hypothetical protein